MKFIQVSNNRLLQLTIYIQGRNKVFTIGQARVNPEHYVIKYVDIR